MWKGLRSSVTSVRRAATAPAPSAQTFDASIARDGIAEFAMAIPTKLSLAMVEPERAGPVDVALARWQRFSGSVAERFDG